jgi:hypothetical protein
MTMSLSGAVLSHHGSRVGNYKESAIVNGHPSWINANHAIWYADDLNDWVVGKIEARGSNVIGIQASGQGTTCPTSIASSDWQYYDGSSWKWFSSSVMSLSCSQAKGKNS